jgi:hypothetical protein
MNPERTSTVSHQILDLLPNQKYAIYCDGQIVGTEKAGREGFIQFEYGKYSGNEQLFEVISLR